MASSRTSKSSFWQFMIKPAKLKFFVLETYLTPVFNLLVRIYMGLIFWNSGVLKWQNWPQTIWLYTNEHPLPYLPVEVAANLGTYTELLCALMLFIGLGARLGAFIFFIMTLFIMNIYPDIQQHQYWLLLLGYITLYGPGRLSVDYYIRRKYLKS
jgi:putative oxidoreductase